MAFNNFQDGGRRHLVDFLKNSLIFEQLLSSGGLIYAIIQNRPNGFCMRYRNLSLIHI